MMKIAQTATAIGLLAASAVFTPALAAMSCWDFTRGSDGSWTPLRPFVLDGPEGMVRIDPGNSYNAACQVLLGGLRRISRFTARESRMGELQGRRRSRTRICCPAPGPIPVGGIGQFLRMVSSF
jgi:hypothetical protein